MGMARGALQQLTIPLHLSSVKQSGATPQALGFSGGLRDLSPGDRLQDMNEVMG